MFANIEKQKRGTFILSVVATSFIGVWKRFRRCIIVAVVFLLTLQQLVQR